MALAQTVKQAFTETKFLNPQHKLDLMRGVQLRRTKGGLPLLTVYYEACPERDPEINPKWEKEERATYSSQGAWDREQRIVDNAGGGELVFADTLITHWNKIVVTDPAWRPQPGWRCEGGFDHGKTNPTALERAYIDYEGNKYLCGEYYVPGKEVWQHVPELAQMPDIRNISVCYADPTIFDDTQQQSGGQRAKSINEIYCDEGFELLSKFAGDRNDSSFASRLHSHWKDLGPADSVLEQMGPEDRQQELSKHRRPTLQIVCRKYAEQPQPGLHPWDCPNLLWELMRTRKKKLTAVQLMHRNPAEEIIDKDNHARDALKYFLMSHPEPAYKSAKELAAEAIRNIPVEDVTSRVHRYQEALAEQEEDAPISLGRRRRLSR